MEENIGMDFNQIAMEYTKIYFQCHPEKLPAEEKEAIKKLQHIHGFFKSKQIDNLELNFYRRQ